jgi:hypothetical protein
MFSCFNQLCFGTGKPGVENKRFNRQIIKKKEIIQSSERLGPFNE